MQSHCSPRKRLGGRLGYAAQHDLPNFAVKESTLREIKGDKTVTKILHVHFYFNRVLV